MIINLLHTAALGICAVSKLVDQDGAKKIKEENDIRRSKLSEQERYDEDHRRYLKNMAR